MSFQEKHQIFDAEVSLWRPRWCKLELQDSNRNDAKKQFLIQEEGRRLL